MSKNSRMLTLAVIAVAGCLSTVASAQCTPGWQPASASSDVGASIRWLRMWDPDGAGAAAPVLVASGDFNTSAPAGFSSAANIATWDGTNWSDLGGGLSAPGYCLASTSGNNNLFVCGTSINTAGGNPARRIARWDGSAWNGMDTGSASLLLLSVAAAGSDSVVVTGAFTTIGDSPVSASRVAAWSPSTGWTALGSGMSSTTSACITMPNGDVIVGGAALTTGDGAITVNRVARWDGTQWHALGSGLNGLVRCFAIMPNGDLIVGGAFTATGDDATPLGHIARWDGTNWSALGTGIGGTGVLSAPAPYAMGVAPNGDLIVAGDFTTAGDNPANNIARWDGSAWSTYGTGLNGPARALAITPGGFAVGGDFTTVNGLPANRFAIWSSAGPATITDQAESMQICPSDTAIFSVTASGSAPLTYQWQQQDLINFPDFIDITDGAVVDSFGNELCQAAGTTTSTLTLTDHSGMAQVYRCVVTNACGSAEGDEVTLTYNDNCPGNCPADVDNGSATGTPDDAVDINDLLFFLSAFEQGNIDLDDDGADPAQPDGGTDINDLLFFLIHFEGGC